MSEIVGKDLARVGTYGRSSLNEKQQYAQALASAGDLVPKTFWTKPVLDPNTRQMIPARPNPGAVLYMLETAAMLGVNPMVGLTNIHIIEGKPSLSANLQAALVREAGHKMRVKVAGEGFDAVATVQIIRSDDPDWTFEVTWTQREAQAAGVMGKDNWKKYFRSMLKARAITECIREACPEVLMGATYSPDELGATTDAQGEPVDLEVVVPDSTPAETAEPRPETPIVDERPAAEPQPGQTENWGEALANLGSREEALALYQEAKVRGALEEPVKVGRKKPRPLGELIVEVGKAFAAAEDTAAADDEPVVATVEDDGSPAVLADDPNVEDAQVVE